MGPLQGAASFVPDDPLLDSIAFSVLVALMFACWLVALAGTQSAGRRWVLGAIVALHVLLLLGPPLPLTDVFNYLNYARLDIVHGLNPYTDVPALVPTDPSYDYATWHHLLSPYGPLFTIASYALVPLGLAGALWTLKAATVAASLGCLWLVWRLAERRGHDPLWAVAFVGLNPLVLVYGVGGVHNDFFMLLAILAGMAAILAGRPARGGAALVTAAALKVSGGLALPFALAGGAPNAGARCSRAPRPPARPRGRVSLAAFGPHLPGLETQSELVTPLSPQNLLGLVLGQGGATALVRALVGVGFARDASCCCCERPGGAPTGRRWRAGRRSRSSSALTWEMPWYVLWVLPFAAIGRSHALRRADRRAHGVPADDPRPHHRLRPHPRVSLQPGRHEDRKAQCNRDPPLPQVTSSAAAPAAPDRRRSRRLRRRVDRPGRRPRASSCRATGCSRGCSSGCSPSLWPTRSGGSAASWSTGCL